MAMSEYYVDPSGGNDTTGDGVSDEATVRAAIKAGL